MKEVTEMDNYTYQHCGHGRERQDYKVKCDRMIIMLGAIVILIIVITQYFF